MADNGGIFFGSQPKMTKISPNLTELLISVHPNDHLGPTNCTLVFPFALWESLKLTMNRARVQSRSTQKHSDLYPTCNHTIFNLIHTASAWAEKEEKLSFLFCSKRSTRRIIFTLK